MSPVPHATTVFPSPPSRWFRPYRRVAPFLAMMLPFFLATPAVAVEVPFASGSAIDAAFDDARAVFAADVDGDGDIDVIGAAGDPNQVVWWENTAGDGSTWSEATIDGTYPGASSVHAADVDGDGDVDVLGAAADPNEITWWENTAGDGSAWTARTVDGAVDGARSVHAADVDGDGDIDVLGAAGGADAVLWWENTAGDGTAWTEHSVDAAFGGAASVVAADVDGDGDIDVLGAADTDNDIVWWENSAGDGSAWTEHVVDAAFGGATGVHAADVDGDGDLDVIGAAASDDDVTWWENALGDGSVWAEHVVDAAFDGAYAVSATDLDADGDLDVLGAALEGDDVVWWENTGGDGSAWTEHSLDASFGGANSVATADVDGDGDVDVLAAARMAGDVAWWENRTIHRSAIHPTEMSVDGAFDGAIAVAAADIDGDGDIDVLGAADAADEIAWWENTAGDGSAWTETTIDGSFDGAGAVYAADIDGDGDLDVLGAAAVADDIAWWENTAGDGSAWTEHTVDGSFDGAISVFAADVDGDGDLDVLGAAELAGDISWWENTVGDGSTWTEHVVDDAFSIARAVAAADLDGDGDIDVVGAAFNADDIAWWENTAGDGSVWTERTIEGDFNGARSIAVADMDGDGDLDVLGAALNADDVTWFENSAGDGTAWTAHVVDGSFNGAFSVAAADIDGDGDMDVAATAQFANGVSWWENTAGDGTAWSEYAVDTAFDSAKSAVAADIDGDGDVDILAAANTDDAISWWENRGGQFSLATSDAAPVAIGLGKTDAVLAITMSHEGRNGDSDEELATLDLIFDDGAGIPLTSAQANAMFDRLEIYLDDGSATFDSGSDTLVTTVTTFALDGSGKQTVSFADGDANVQVVFGTAETFFVALVADSVAAAPGTVRVTHATETTSSAEDRSADLAIVLEYVANAASSVVALCGDGVVRAGEQCDDGNDLAGDGCDATCQVENDFFCAGEPSTCSACSTTCGAGTGTNGSGGAVCSVGADRVCGACGPGTLNTGSALTCEACATCPVGEGETTACTASVDTVCGACTDGVNFSDGADNASCEACTVCIAGQSGACTASTDTACEVPMSSGQPIAAAFDDATAVHVADIDGDGDLDVLGAAAVADTVSWWANTAGDGSAWSETEVDTAFDGASAVFPVDMDGDGDLDVLGAAEDANDIVWWENTAGDGSAWTATTVDGEFDGAASVVAADLDGDGDPDVLGAGFVANEIAWWENTAGDGSAWTKHSVNLTFNGATSVDAADVDGDGDLDILGAAFNADDIAWFENTVGDGSTWAKVTIDGVFNGANSVTGADVDGDGDIDVLAAAQLADDVTWWENTAGDGTAWTEKTIEGAFDGASSVFAIDFDGDGDNDVVAAADTDDAITWWENAATDGSRWSEHSIDGSFDGAAAAVAADVDGDGDIDAIGAAGATADGVTWWANQAIHRSAIHPTEHVVDAEFGGAAALAAADLDGDGDRDILAAASVAGDVAWFANTDGDGSAWSANIIEADFAGATAVSAGDIDGDGDTDVLGAANGDDDIAWFENTAGDGSAWTEQVIAAAFDGAASVVAADIDGDGDLDVLGAADTDDDVTWWENALGDGSVWTEHLVDESFAGAAAAIAADIDGDGDIDVLAAARVADDITWWENDGLPCTSGVSGTDCAWTERTVSADFDGATGLFVVDIDRDGDLDVLAAAADSGDVSWFENTAGDGSAWAERNVEAAFSGASAVSAADVDADGDIDVLATAGGDGDVAWWENTTGDASAWTKHTVSSEFAGAAAVLVVDVDADGDRDVLGAATAANDIRWWENRGGQFSLTTTDTSPSGILPGGMDDVLAIRMTHEGRSGDSDEELATLELLFDDGLGTPLTTADGNDLLDSLDVYLDDGSASFEPGSDTLVTTVSTFALDAQGVQTISFADGDPNVQVGFGTDETFFVVVTTASSPSTSGPFRVTHVTEASSTAEDRIADLRIVLEYAENVSSGSIIIPVCGDSVVEGGEDCDDGGTLDGDCCSSSCEYESVGSSCGSAADTECSNPDTCDGAGTCLANDESPGFACGDAGTECVVQDTCDGNGTCDDNGFVAALTACGSGTDAECSNPDSCDGAGNCDPRDESSGFACGDPSDTECTDPDTCDGSGTCEDNHELVGFSCGDSGTECIVADACDGSGSCADGGFVAEFTACGSAADTECSNPDSCDGSGSCDPRDETIGFSCGDAGTECTIQDTCDGSGSCTDNGFQPALTACGDTGTECIVQDTCDGSGTCDDNGFVAAGTSCGETVETECSNADTCDGVGACSDNHKIDGLSCDDSNACTGSDECTSGTCGGTAITGCGDSYVTYKAKAPKKDVGGAEIPDKNQLPKGWVITVNDKVIEAMSPGDDNPENFEVRRPKSLLNPATKNDAPGPDAPDLHYVRYQMRLGKQSVAPAEDGKFPKPPKHINRIWALENDLGTVRILTKKATTLLLPVATDLSMSPAAPADATHYICYQARLIKDDTDQSPGGKFSKNLQAYFEDEFDDCALDKEGGTSFDGTDVAGKCLFDVKKIKEFCNPMDKAAVTDGRDTSAPGTVSSTTTSTKSLLCYAAKLSGKLTSPEAAAFIPATPGDRISPKQSKHVKLRVKDGNPVHVTPGNDFSAPVLLESNGLEMVCLPTEVLSVTQDP